MIDEAKTQMMIEVIQARNQELEQYHAKFHELLLLFDHYSEIVNGHPAKAVEILKEMKTDIDAIKISLCNTPNDEVKLDNNDKNIKVTFWTIILFIFLLVFSGFLGALFFGLLFV